MKNNYRRGGGLNWEDGLINVFQWIGGGCLLEGGGLFETGGLNRVFTIRKQGRI